MEDLLRMDYQPPWCHWASSAVAIAQGGSGERGEPWRVKAAAHDDGDGRSETTQARERGRQRQRVAWTPAAAVFRTREEERAPARSLAVRVGELGSGRARRWRSRREAVANEVSPGE
ncbi:hypothetical protein Syun_028339 [Stephania yunnanensis]|uniref:Uncharacterized protein n=1 Tax=Stephania yunnanensis TaxID=152371 RepID=A0AAP0EPI7_9MAGN